jgi:hypothetical protein
MSRSAESLMKDRRCTICQRKVNPDRPSSKARYQYTRAQKVDKRSGEVIREDVYLCGKKSCQDLFDGDLEALAREEGRDVEEGPEEQEGLEQGSAADEPAPDDPGVDGNGGGAGDGSE